MNTKAVIPLVAGLGVAGLAAKLGLDYVKKAQAGSSKTVELWSVNADVPRGMTIDEPMLVALKFPADCAAPTAITDKKNILGRVPHTGVPAGVPILDSMLLAPGAKAGVYVPAGFRAVAVKINESSGVDYHLEPGCHVDVVGYFTIKVEGKPETVARTILENIEVAAVGQRLAPDAPSGNDKDKKNNNNNADKPVRAATLLVKPEQVPTLMLAEQKGEIKLSMRGTDDASLTGGADKVFGSKLTGDSEAKPQPPAGAPQGGGGGLGDLIAGWMNGSKDKDARAASTSKPPADVAKNEPEEPAAPQFESTMVIYLGNEKKVFGWVAGRPNEPMEVSSSEGNIFEPQEHKAGKTGDSKSKLKSKPARPADEPKQPEQPEPPQAPKELIG